MSALDWLATLLGTAMVLLIVVDVLLTVLHLDLDGYIARSIVRILWRMLCTLANFFTGGTRRLILSIAGPLMMACIMLAWAAIYLIGFALIYWPHLEHFRSENALGELGFVDALHFSGGTGTVLGFGDITPLAPWLQVLAFVEAGVGFAMLSGIVAWLINLSTGVTERNTLARRMHDESQGTGDGALLIARRARNASDLQSYLQNLVEAAQMVREKMRQFPLIDLFYRSRDPLLDPERMIKTLAEAAITLRLLAASQPDGRYQAAAEDLDRAVSGVIITVSEQHLPYHTQQQIFAPHPTDEDRRTLQRIEKQLDLDEYQPPAPEELPLQLAARTRILLLALDRLTRWQTRA